MKKFDEVNKAIMDLTADTENWVRLSKKTDCRHSGKYVLRNIYTNNAAAISYKTLNEVIKEFDLKI